MLTGRLSGGSLVMSRPRSRIVPLVGSSNPPIIRKVVVLPQPEGRAARRTRRRRPRARRRRPPEPREIAFRGRAAGSRGTARRGDVIAMRRLAEVAVPCWRASRATQRTGRRGRTKVPAVRTNRPEGGLARLAYGRITHYREKTWTSDHGRRLTRAATLAVGLSLLALLPLLVVPVLAVSVPVTTGASRIRRCRPDRGPRRRPFTFSRHLPGQCRRDSRTRSAVYLQ